MQKQQSIMIDNAKKREVYQINRTNEVISKAAPDELHGCQAALCESGEEGIPQDLESAANPSGAPRETLSAHRGLRGAVSPGRSLPDP